MLFKDQKTERLAVLLASAVLIATVTWIDATINPELAFTFFYLIPIILLTIHFGIVAGILSSVLCSLLWFIADYIQFKSHPYSAVPYWNDFVNLAIFVLIAMMVAKLQTELERTRKDKADLERMNAEILKLSKVKTDFCSMVSHELRTPMATIRESINVMNDGLVGQVTDEQKRCLGVTRRNVDRLIHLINDVLDFTRLDRGKKELELRPRDLNQLISENIEFLRPLAEKKGLTIRTDLAPDLPMVDCEEDSVLQVLSNVIGNAIKFTETGSIVASTRRDGDNAEVTVQDSGCGIPASKIHRLFLPFERIAWESGIKVEGSGLGLAITRHLVELHGGKIWAESEAGSGTKIHFTFPLSKRS